MCTVTIHYFDRIDSIFPSMQKTGHNKNKSNVLIGNKDDRKVKIQIYGM